jgi:two-component system, NarL family, nitrate/nitrite response regulator NarL
MSAPLLPAILRLVGLRCLIVDDNVRFREELRGLLEEEGMEVVGTAACAGDAVQQVDKLRPDVVLVDIDLGADSGFDLARRLMDQANGATPYVILISTHDETEFADLIEASPASGFLAKTELTAPAIQRIIGIVD